LSMAGRWRGSAPSRKVSGWPIRAGRVQCPAMSSSQAQSAGTKAAFGPRRLQQAKLRLWAYRALKQAGKRPAKGFPDYLQFAPRPRDAREFSDLSARVSCYLLDAGLPLYLPGSRFPLDASLVPHFDPSLVRDPGWVHDRPEGVGHLVVHRLSPKTSRTMATSRVPFTVVDTRLHAYSEMQYFALRNAATWPTYRPAEAALERLRELGGPGSSAFVLATGPSAQEVDLATITADVRITCNSAVRDHERIKMFRPNIITFMDPVFHFGPSRYAAAFRKDVVRAAEEADTLVVCGDTFAGPLLGLEPSLRGRLVVIPHQDGGPWRWPTDRNPTMRQAGNVLTGLMLPLALMLADEVAIAGADGRQPSENYYWKHNPALQYSGDLMQTVFDAHPAFFRDRDYEDYYDEHCANLEALISLGEARGKTVRGATSSWVPALRTRGAPTPEVIA
jgi:hypothetical protein